MNDKKEVIELKLHENYEEVLKKKMSACDNVEKLEEDFSNRIKDFENARTEENAETVKLEAEINAKYMESLNEINSTHNNLLSDNKEFEKEIREKDQDEQNVISEQYESETGVLNERIAQITEEYENQAQLIKTKYEADVAECDKSILEFEKNLENEQIAKNSKLDEEQEKYEAKISDINEKKEAKLEKLRAAFDVKEEKFHAEIEKEKDKVESQISVLKPEFEDKLVEIKVKLKTEKERFDAKLSNSKATLESKVARHEKFMFKSQSDNDKRAVNQHKKDISDLKKNFDKELKTVNKEYEENFIVLDAKKKDLIVNGSNKIANVQSDFVKFREDKLYQIDLCRVNLNDEVNTLNLNTKLQLEDELNKFNEFVADNERSFVIDTKTNGIEIAKQEDARTQLKILFDKTNDLNKIQNKETKTTKEKDLTAVNLTRSSSEELQRINLSVELAKLENENKVALINLEQNIKINEENELIEIYNNSAEIQKSNNKEFLEYQKELVSLFTGRSEEILQFEELELDNRIDLKIEVLKNQEKRLANDLEALNNKINAVFDEEISMFKSEIDALSKKDLEELKKYEKKANKNIDSIVAKRNALDSKAYKKEIRLMDLEILDKKEELVIELHACNQGITDKTEVYNEGLAGATKRLETALKEAKELKDMELARINNAIDLIKQMKKDELVNIKDRLSQTSNDTSKFLENVELRFKRTEDEIVSYLNKRVENEEDIIKNAKANFESRKNKLSTKLDEFISDAEIKRREVKELTKSKILKEEEALEMKITGFEKQVFDFEEKSRNKSADQKNKFKVKNEKVEQRHSNHIIKVNNQLKDKVAKHVLGVGKIDKATVTGKSDFENDKRVIQKKYDVALSKELAIIEQKLQQDLKNA